MSEARPVTQRSPVPEWFGKDDAAPVRTGREGRGGGGCGVLVLLLLIAAGAGGYWFMAEQKSKAAERDRVARQALDEARLQSERREAERREAEAAAIAAAAPEPEPEPEPEAAKRTQQEIQQVLRDLNPRFRACYDTALGYAPDAEGTVQLTIMIGTDGLVRTAETNVTGDLPAPVERCIQTVAKTARFAEGEEQMVAFPLVFRQD